MIWYSSGAALLPSEQNSPQVPEWHREAVYCSLHRASVVMRAMQGNAPPTQKTTGGDMRKRKGGGGRGWFLLVERGNNILPSYQHQWTSRGRRNEWSERGEERERRELEGCGRHVRLASPDWEGWGSGKTEWTKCTGVSGHNSQMKQEHTHQIASCWGGGGWIEGGGPPQTFTSLMTAMVLPWPPPFWWAPPHFPQTLFNVSVFSPSSLFKECKFTTYSPSTKWNTLKFWFHVTGLIWPI